MNKWEFFCCDNENISRSLSKLVVLSCYVISEFRIDVSII